MPEPPKMRVPQMQRMGAPRMQQIGHYRPPQLKLPGALNRPTVGRIGKNTPSIKQFTPLMPRRRERRDGR